MVHGHLDCFQKPPGDHGTPNAYNRWYILLYHVSGPAWIEFHWNSTSLGLVTYGCTLHLRIRYHTTWCWRCVGYNLWALSFGLSRYHGQGSWLVCDVALSARWWTCTNRGRSHFPHGFWKPNGYHIHSQREDALSVPTPQYDDYCIHIGYQIISTCSNVFSNMCFVGVHSKV